MQRAIWAGALALSLAGAALANGYRDFNAGSAATVRGDHDAAIRSFSLALTDSDLPEHLRASALYGRASEYAEEKKYDEAIADYTAAIAAKPDWVDPYVHRCGVYAEKEMQDKAVADCTTAIQMQPQSWNLRRARINLYFRVRDYADILPDYTTFIAARPGDAGLLVERATVLQLMGQFDKTLADADAAHDIAPKWEAPFATKARAYFALGDFKKATDADESAIDRGPDDAGLYIMKGQALWAMGKFDDASDAFADALDHDKLEPAAFLWLTVSQSLAHAKFSPKITERFSAADRTSWPWPIVQLYLGKTKPDALLAMKGRDPDVIDDYQCPIGFFVAEWQRMQGNMAEAKRLLQSSADLCAPNSTQREYAIVALGQLP